MVVGETSGDNLGAGLMDALAAQVDSLNFSGIAGPRMRSRGAVSWHDMDAISVMGFDGLIKELPGILRIRGDLTRRLSASRPDVFVGIDVPDFNLGLEERLKKAGIPTVHYVSPTVWAWRSYRIRRIRRAVTHMLALFPFEARFYEEHGVPVSFVGHPMADDITGEEDGAALRQEYALTTDAPVVALLPGSRLSEVDRLAPAFLEAAAILRRERPGIQFVVPLASPRVREAFERCQRDFSGDSQDIYLVDGRARDVMAAADVVLLASGTAALEAALLRKPMVVTYRVSAASAMLIRRFIRVEHFSMPNHLLKEPRIPELIQEDATPDRMAAEIGRWLDTPEAMHSLRDEFAEIHAELRCDASARSADAILGVVRAARGEPR